MLFLLTDDLNMDEISVMPHLKSLLIDQGVSFSNYFVSVSLCCPSRSTTLRGQYSHNTHVETNGGTNGGFQTAYTLGLEQSTIGTWLHSAGYRTAMIGKYLNGYPGGVSDTYIPPGWDEWDSASKGNPYSEFNYTLNENGKLVAYGKQSQDYGTDVYTSKATSFITQSAKEHKPFFTYLAVYAPHQPATPAPRDQHLFPDVKAPHTPSYNEADTSDKPAYIHERPLLSAQAQTRIDQLYRKRLQSLQAVDRAIATLYTTLQKTNQLNTTYIVFTSDNGFHLGQHRLPAGKQTAYEEDIHLPLVVRGPGVPAGKTVDQITGNIDLAPSFADMAGVKPASFVDGRSFLPLVHGNMPTTWRQSYLVEHWLQQNSAHPQTNLGLQESDDPDQETDISGSKAAKIVIPEYHAIRTKDYLYVEYSTGEKELYNLKTDPAELSSLAATAGPLLLKSLSERLATLKSCKMDTCRSMEDQPAP
ncbi:sulfatase family protein [Reticulibacter mediterranei]